ncbi:hypothetical protein [Nesterenkonia halobia]|uniref:Uncharacterized protein n=1 Tax=Nesterenkonia halobia TaxID=37922 RepID=A0ABP6RF37_9MICC
MSDDATQGDGGQQPSDGVIGQSVDRLRLWLEGEQANSNSVDVLVDENADLEKLTELSLGDASWVFVEESQASEAADIGAALVPYGGRLEPLGGELSLSPEVLIQTESYATAPYVSVSVPTAFSVVDDVDLSALRTDVEKAQNRGEFPEHLTLPIATVLDERSWLSPLLPRRTRATRLLVRADGSVLDGPFGNPVDSDLTLTEPTEEPHDDAVAMARFLGAAKVIRALRPRLNATISVAGFGPDADASASERTDAVFVAAAEDHQYVVNLENRRVDRVPTTVAEFVESVFNAPDEAVINTEEQTVLDALGLQATLNTVRERTAQ